MLNSKNNINIDIHELKNLNVNLKIWRCKIFLMAKKKNLEKI